MAEDTGGLPPDAAETVDGRFLRRPVRGPGARLREALARPDSVTLVLLGCAALVLAVPASFALAVPAGIAYRIWAGRHRGALPFRAPKSWKGPDYGNPLAQPRGGFAPASGILHLGRDDATSQELWIGNSDARRHGFFIGTTGSGKALPLDTPVLTPRGWVANGDLRPGDAVCHPGGGATRVVSVHPQGAVRAVRVCFADGRETLCSADHLWHVRIRPAEGRRAGARAETEERRAGARAEIEERVMEARDIGILLGVRGGDIDLSAPLAAPFRGPRAAGRLSEADAMRAAREGFAALDYMPSVVGAPQERIRFVAQWIRHAAPQMESGPDGLRLRGLDSGDAAALKQIAWSLGRDGVHAATRRRAARPRHGLRRRRRAGRGGGAGSARGAAHRRRRARGGADRDVLHPGCARRRALRDRGACRDAQHRASARRGVAGADVVLGLSLHRRQGDDRVPRPGVDAVQALRARGRHAGAELHRSGRRSGRARGRAVGAVQHDQPVLEGIARSAHQPAHLAHGRFGDFVGGHVAQPGGGARHRADDGAVRAARPRRAESRRADDPRLPVAWLRRARRRRGAGRGREGGAAAGGGSRRRRAGRSARATGG